MLNFKDLISQHQKEALQLHQKINPQIAKVWSTIGFDKNYIRAQGASLWDDAGQEYLDFLSGYGVFTLGRNHLAIHSAIKDLLDANSPSLIQMAPPLLSGLLAEKLIKIFGHGIRDMVFFSNSGTEAVEAAIKFARGHTKRTKMLCLNHAFHGLTTGSLSVNGNDEFRNGYGDLLPSKIIPMNDLEILEKELKTKEYAAFIFEPIQGKGVFLPHENFFNKACELCHKFGTLVIADEVQSGMGRTGKWLACDQFGIEPDILCLSKGLTAGVIPVGTTLYKREIYNSVYSSMERCLAHSNTYGQNDLAMACALTVLSLYESESILQNVNKMGSYFFTRLNELKTKHEWIKDIRGKGLMIGIEFSRPASFKKRIIWDTIHKINQGLFTELIVMPLLSEHHMLTQVAGHNQDILKLIPPLNIGEKHVDRFVEALDSVLEKCDHVTGPVLTMGKNLAKHVIKR